MTAEFDPLEEGRRRDLGFFAQRIADRLKREFSLQ
jgi:hypothetical protein